MVSPMADSDARIGWRIPDEQEDDDRFIVVQKQRKNNKAKVTVPHVPLQRFNSASTVATTAKKSTAGIGAKGRCVLRQSHVHLGGVTG